MTWSETHRRWRALREVEEALATGADLPWNDEYAAIFGEPARLVEAIRYRRRLSYETQLDSHLPEHVLDEQRRRLEHRFAGVRRLLDRYDTIEEADRVPA